jgi:hypothetical protein
LFLKAGVGAFFGKTIGAEPLILAGIRIAVVHVRFAKVAVKAKETLASEAVDAIHAESAIFTRRVSAVVHITLAIVAIEAGSAVAIVAIGAIDTLGTVETGLAGTIIHCAVSEAVIGLDEVPIVASLKAHDQAIAANRHTRVGLGVAVPSFLNGAIGAAAVIRVGVAVVTGFACDDEAVPTNRGADRGGTRAIEALLGQTQAVTAVA